MTYILMAVVFTLCFIFYRRAPEHEPVTRLFYRLGMIASAAAALLHFLFWNFIVSIPKGPPPGSG